MSILFSIALWLIAGLSIVSKNAEGTIEIKRTYFVLPMFFPPLMQMAGVPEIRFFLPLYVCLYSFVCIAINYRKLIAWIKPRVSSVIFVMAVVLFMWVAVFTSILSRNREYVMLVNETVIENNDKSM